MNIIGVLDKPTAGEYVLDGVNIHDATTTTWRPSATAKSGSCSRRIT